jgi:hypothetical protein
VAAIISSGLNIKMKAKKYKRDFGKRVKQGCISLDNGFIKHENSNSRG